MWEKIKSELASLFFVQNSSIVEGLKTSVVGELNSLKQSLAASQDSLKQAAKDLQAAQDSNSLLSAESSAIANQISASLTALKIETKADATSAEKIQAITDGVSATLAKLAVDSAKLPGTSADNAGNSSVISQLEAEKDPVKRAKLFKANSKAIAATALAK